MNKIRCNLQPDKSTNNGFAVTKALFFLSTGKPKCIFTVLSFNGNKELELDYSYFVDAG